MFFYRLRDYQYLLRINKICNKALDYKQVIHYQYHFLIYVFYL